MHITIPKNKKHLVDKTASLLLALQLHCQIFILCARGTFVSIGDVSDILYWFPNEEGLLGTDVKKTKLCKGLNFYLLLNLYDWNLSNPNLQKSVGDKVKLLL